MGIKIQNLEKEVTTGVVGDETEKTILHYMNTIPSFVFLTSRTAGADPVLVSTSRTNIVVKGMTGTFDVLIVR